MNTVAFDCRRDTRSRCLIFALILMLGGLHCSTTFAQSQTFTGFIGNGRFLVSTSYPISTITLSGFYIGSTSYSGSAITGTLTYNIATNQVVNWNIQIPYSILLPAIHFSPGQGQSAQPDIGTVNPFGGCPPSPLSGYSCGTPAGFVFTNSNVVGNVQNISVEFATSEQVQYIPAQNGPGGPNNDLYAQSGQVPGEPSTVSWIGVTASLIDPVSLNPGDGTSLLTGSAITSDLTLLATQAITGRHVNGVATDGVSQVVLSIPSITPGEQFTLTVDPSSCPSLASADCGIIFDPSAPPTNLFGNPTPYTLTVTSTPSANSAIAFAAYRGPADFVRIGSTADQNLGNRTISVNVYSNYQGNLPSISIPLVRPPIVLIHGNWSTPTAWESFLKPLYAPNVRRYNYDADGRFYFARLDYHKELLTGVAKSTETAKNQLSDINNTFRSTANVAAVQIDAVGYSMGGLLARQLSQDSATLFSMPFGVGPFHKLITLDTPHNGSPFANALLATSSNRCKAVINFGTTGVQQNIVDLEQGSTLIENLGTLHSTAKHIPTHAVVGTADGDQATASITAISKPINRYFCGSLLPQGGFEKLFNEPSDLIVGNSSASAKGLGIINPIPTSQPNISGSPVPVIHTVNNPLFQLGPDILGHDISYGATIDAYLGPSNVITQHVLDLLNSPVTSSSYAPILP